MRKPHKGTEDRPLRLTDILIRMLGQKGVEEAFIAAGLAAALNGDFRAWSYIWDRIEGRMGGVDEDVADFEAILRTAKKRAEARRNGNGHTLGP
jgi:hypothetical protein